MIPVDQTRWGLDENGKVYGNCFAACIASLLECSLEEVDTCFCEGDDWWERAVACLSPHGVFMLDFSLDWEGDRPFPFCAIPTGALCIISGPSPRFAGANHACIGRAALTIDSEGQRHLGFELVHDPHPSREGFQRDRYPTAVVFLVAFSPASVNAGGAR